MRHFNKQELLQVIISQLTNDLNILLTAAKTAHEAATHEENIPDNKYDTLALEASYVAQGQANRAREIRKSIEIYKQLKLRNANDETIQLTSLVTLEDHSGTKKTVFIGPIEGGLKIEHQEQEVVLITPGSPMGRELIGKCVGDSVEVEAGICQTEYEIVEVC